MTPLDIQAAAETLFLAEKTGRQAEKPADAQDMQKVRASVADQDRERVRDKFPHQDRDRRADLNIRVNIGVSIPRTVELYAVPVDIIEVVPAYRGFRYFYSGDDICIVDPQTYVVVDVIHRGNSRRADTSGRLELSQDEIRLIRSSIDRRDALEKYDGKLSTGVELPRSVNLSAFPDAVISEVPELKVHHYALIDDGIAIVEDNRVVLVIED